MIKGILWILRTGAPWWDLPDRYGAWETVSGRF
ncbi:transposase [Leptothermofonsia sichuanensis E412]|nr:transposase [Leptothermofonsia sichuanensis E412]